LAPREPQESIVSKCLFRTTDQVMPFFLTFPLKAILSALKATSMPGTGQEHIENLFKSHYYQFYNLAYQLVKDSDAAKDIVQDVFYKVWKNQEKINFDDQPVGYLLKATSRTALNYIRNHKRIIRLEEDSPLTNTLKASPGVESIDYSELEQRTQQAIDSLPPKRKVIFILSRQGMKYSEIAETLGISVKTIENQMGAALQKLRNDLKPFITPELIIVLLGVLISLIIYFSR
jgi:RNA polymerase sigma-70 factor (ECF subfamily)